MELTMISPSHTFVVNWPFLKEHFDIVKRTLGYILRQFKRAVDVLNQLRSKSKGY